MFGMLRCRCRTVLEICQALVLHPILPLKDLSVGVIERKKSLQQQHMILLLDTPLTTSAIRTDIMKGYYAWQLWLWRETGVFGGRQPDIMTTLMTLIVRRTTRKEGHKGHKFVKGNPSLSHSPLYKGSRAGQAFQP